MRKRRSILVPGGLHTGEIKFYGISNELPIEFDMEPMYITHRWGIGNKAFELTSTVGNMTISGNTVVRNHIRILLGKYNTIFTTHNNFDYRSNSDTLLSTTNTLSMSSFSSVLLVPSNNLGECVDIVTGKQIGRAHV